ncbi:hypothetical protein [Methanolobus psychrotolerans]|uniref:hypothetical protein n=1 Tax=Methanolobus psychrotolerans TaxID=1874706 RepID=UPI000B91866D|nr:hypothetical protein [Methanolobus psychrotolerans]
MAENDLLSEICRSLGRIEQKVDDVRSSYSRQLVAHEKLDERVSFLEQCRQHDRGIVAGISLVVSALVWFFLVLTGRI